MAGSDATRSTTPRDFFAARFFASPPVWDPPPHDSSGAATPATANPRGPFSAAADPQPPIATRRSAFYRFAPMILPLDWLVPERQDDGGKTMTSPRTGRWTGDLSANLCRGLPAFNPRREQTTAAGGFPLLLCVLTPSLWCHLQRSRPNRLAGEWRQGNDEPGPAPGSGRGQRYFGGRVDATRVTTPRDFFAAHFFASPPLWHQPPPAGKLASAEQVSSEKSSYHQNIPTPNSGAWGRSLPRAPSLPPGGARPLFPEKNPRIEGRNILLVGRFSRPQKTDFRSRPIQSLATEHRCSASGWPV